MEERQDDTFDAEVVSINFGAIWKIIKKEWWLIAIFTLVVGGAAAYVALKTKDEFVSQGTILPEVSGGGSGTLGGIAGLIGMGGFELGLKNSTDAIRPDLYPSVINSTTFMLNLLNQKVHTREGKEVLFENFYNKYIASDAKVKPESIKKYPVNIDGVINMSRQQELRIKDLKDRVTATLDKKTGEILISAKMPDPVVAADVARYAMGYLTEYVTNYRIEKARRDVDFYGQKVASARGKYYSTQERKAAYSDEFQLPTIRLQSADIQRERIESEYKMSANVYNELLKKFEEAKIKLQQETPVFKLLDPPVIPTAKSEPKRSLMVFIGCIIGTILGIIAAILYRKNYKKVFQA